MSRINEVVVLGAAFLLVGCALGNHSDAHATGMSGDCAMPPTASISGSWTVGTQGYRAELWKVAPAGEFVVCIINLDLHKEVARASATIAEGENFATHLCNQEGLVDSGIFALGKPGEAGAFTPRMAWRFEPESQTLRLLDVATVNCIYSD